MSGSNPVGVVQDHVVLNQDAFNALEINWVNIWINTNSYNFILRWEAFPWSWLVQMSGSNPVGVVQDRVVLSQDALNALETNWVNIWVNTNSYNFILRCVKLEGSFLIISRNLYRTIYNTLYK